MMPPTLPPRAGESSEEDDNNQDSDRDVLKNQARGLSKNASNHNSKKRRVATEEEDSPNEDSSYIAGQGLISELMSESINESN